MLCVTMRARAHTHARTHACTYSRTHRWRWCASRTGSTRLMMRCGPLDTGTRARALTHSHVRTRTHARTHARAHSHALAREHTHTHLQILRVDTEKLRYRRGQLHSFGGDQAARKRTSARQTRGHARRHSGQACTHAHAHAAYTAGPIDSCWLPALLSLSLSLSCPPARSLSFPPSLPPSTSPLPSPLSLLAHSLFLSPPPFPCFFPSPSPLLLSYSLLCCTKTERDKGARGLAASRAGSSL